MSLFGSTLCAMNRHQPKRRDVRWDGACYVGECRRCGVPIERKSRKTWHKVLQFEAVDEPAPPPSP